jgi:hypothetical protein
MTQVGPEHLHDVPTREQAQGATFPLNNFPRSAEFERNLIWERTQVSTALDLYEKRHPIAEICRTLKISKPTLYRYIKTKEGDQ